MVVWIRQTDNFIRDFWKDKVVGSSVHYWIVDLEVVIEMVVLRLPELKKVAYWMSSLLQLDNELFSKRTCTWLCETVIDAELSAPRIPVQK